MKALLRICFIVTCALLFFTVITVHPVLAQTQGTTNNYFAQDVNPNVPQDMHSLTQVATTEVLSTIICQLSGIDIIRKNQSCLGIDPQTHRIGFVPPGSGGLIGATMMGINFTFNIPVHSSDYLQYMAGKFGVTEHAYAQTTGIGFEGLKPLLGLWTAFRNIVYLFFVIIFVIIGIAIMLRVQIDPRTVMTLENQLPRIVIGIILVTFSYAIAGLMIDVMWLLTFLVVNIIASADTSNPALIGPATTSLLNGPLGYVDAIFKTGAFGGVLAITGNAIHAASDVIHNVVSGTNTQQLGLMPTNTGSNGNQSCDWVALITAPLNPIGTAPGVTGCANQLLSTFTTQTVGSILLNIVGWLIGYILGALAGIVILVALLITMFRLWFTLLMAFAYILLDVILAPFHIAAGLIPGSTVGFGSWFRGMAANLLLFPTTVAMFVLARVLLDAFNTTVSVSANSGIVPQAFAATGTYGGGSLFQPPLIGSFVGDGTNNPLGTFVALAIIFATPAVLDILKKALQVQENGLGAAAMSNVGVGGKAVGGTVRRASNLVSAYQIDPLHATPMQRVLSSIFR